MGHGGAGALPLAHPILHQRLDRRRRRLRHHKLKLLSSGWEWFLINDRIFYSFSNIKILSAVSSNVMAIYEHPRRENVEGEGLDYPPRTFDFRFNPANANQPELNANSADFWPYVGCCLAYVHSKCGARGPNVSNEKIFFS